MSDSILDSVKSTINLVEGDDSYDSELVLLINSSLSTLTQLGVGPVEGFEITGSSETWREYLGTDPVLNLVKNYVRLSCRLAFDTPTLSFVLDAHKQQIKELEWRIEVHTSRMDGIDNVETV